MNAELHELRSYLSKEYETRTKLNPLYSKRAYSRDLGISMTSLNDFLSGKRSLCFENINKIFRYLGKKSAIACSWCGEPKQKAKRLIAGPRRQYVCETCVETCNEILRTNKQRPNQTA
jgi:hypothetical protein